MELQVNIFSELFSKITRGNFRGIFSNAKPIYLLSLIDLIPVKTDNRFLLSDKILNKLYLNNINQFDTNCKTALINPYFHLGSEPFYELVWKSNKRPETNSHTPSAKYLRENLAYAKLDDELWLLLQVQENRDYLKQVIINRYLKNNINLQ